MNKGKVRYTPRKHRSPLKWHGGKSYLARRIIDSIPEGLYETFVDATFGGGSVLLNLEEFPREYAYDMDFGLVHFWEILRDKYRFPELLGLYEKTPYTLESFQEAMGYFNGAHPDQGCRYLGSERSRWALRYLARNRMSRGGLGKDFAWSDRKRGGLPGDENAWRTIGREMEWAHKRLGRTMFTPGLPAQWVISAHDRHDTLIYVDLPYLSSVRTVQNAYSVEAQVDPSTGDEDRQCRELLNKYGLDHTTGNLAHAQLLLRALRINRATVMISHYSCPLYDETLTEWDKITWDMPNHSGQGSSKQRRTEALYVNRNRS